MNIAITGASGRLARRTAELLLEQLHPSQLLLLTRTPDALADLAKRGVHVEKASFKNPTGLKQVLAGVDRLFMVSMPPGPTRLDLQRQAVACAERAGVEHVVYTSMAQPSADNPSFLIPDHAATEQAIRESGLEWTFLRNNAYAQEAVGAAVLAAETGSLATNAGDGAVAWVSRADCARSAAAVLATDGHERTAYDITGPEAFTATQLAALVAELAGVEVAVEPRDDDGFFDALIDAEIPQERADLWSAIGEAARGGFMRKVSTDAADLTGRPATPLRDVLARALSS